MIQIKDLSHHFELGKKGSKTSIPVLHNISLTIDKKEIVAIVGKSGSGKSTLLNLIGGFMRPSKGDIWIDETNVTKLNEAGFADFRLNHIGFIFQNFQLIPSMTAYQNVELPLILKGIDERKRTEITKKTLKRVGLLDYHEHYPSELSGGQQQRVSIARALVLNPPIILADEPTGSLDSETEADLLGFIQQLNQELGITFLIITHDDEVASIGNRVIEIRDGWLMEGSVSL
ncbi:ABC transporter ATP-binding protein YtrE [Paraliobacillus sp. PM-2]|uniref:ABC transporter ATP-binding protein n=1 Tax=Paraliobacillus sp. PM-2 TaxID=1462524 RepID=UPI00061BA465|nr:ABC transporter ATP-binding protein [Paraliobacillus sp. PM-2]CQR48288.1 ABC transporter ATP-binding protein YtrE [Paraliobacillus sp. PM-2]